MESNADFIEKRVFDLNILVVYLVKGHPGFEFVSQVVEEGLRGVYIPVIMDFRKQKRFISSNQRIDTILENKLIAFFQS